ncbi:hypothetical protein [Geodermatophilus sp. SYSU D01176]
MTSQPPQPPGGYAEPPGEGGDGRRPDGGQPAGQPRPGSGQPSHGAQYPQPPYGYPQYGYPQYGYPQYGQPSGAAPYGQPSPYGQPGYGQPGYGPPYPQYHGQPAYGQQPWAPPGHGQPQYGHQPVGRGPQVGTDRRRPDRGDLLVAVCAAAFLLFAALPWFSFDFGFGFAESINGFDFGLVTTAAVLLVVAAAWALLPAVVELDPPFPRGFVTVGLTGLACLLTLVEWLTTFEGGFSVFALLTVLAAAAALTVAVLTLLRQLRTQPAASAGGTPWPSPPQSAQPWQPPAYGQHQPPASEQFAPPPSEGDRDTRRPGGSTASGAGTDPTA